ncbi:hypothetical protein HMPREF0373_02857 [Eubacterium ramulus ATCC 29099]|uniref:Uncharacterized protein n=1 Tax=Eubacterium ramulus ATCC 29099 TaxID=1256908 RepID=U2PEF0_EUBRA|nr:hypothetical protein HMPREF0373_02857 [Eubacterium ramulus ATCC 29099]
MIGTTKKISYNWYYQTRSQTKNGRYKMMIPCILNDQNAG